MRAFDLSVKRKALAREVSEVYDPMNVSTWLSFYRLISFDLILFCLRTQWYLAEGVAAAKAEKEEKILMRP